MGYFIINKKEYACYFGCSNNCRYCYAKKIAIRFNRKTEESWKIMEINQKKVEKTLRKIALNELKIKRPQNVKLLRMKSTQIFTKGTILKILSIRQIQNPYYAIVEQR